MKSEPKKDIRVQAKFSLKNGKGYEFEMMDLGGDGVKISLSDDEDSYAVLLVPAEVHNAIEWLTNTIGLFE